MSIAFLFPGQGAQRPGFLNDLPSHPAAQRTLQEAARTLALDPLSLDSPDSLKSTVAVQLSVLIAGVATARALAASGLVPDFVAGHSIGSFTAAVVAGALVFEDALQLVRLRAQYMESAYSSGYGMAAIVGLREPDVRAIVADVGGPKSRIYIAGINAPRQITVTGKLESLELATERALRLGAQRATLLALAVPSHSQLMGSVAERFRPAFESITMSDARAVYVCNHNARAARCSDDIREDLIVGLERPVLWHDSTTLMVELGARLFVEPPPGSVLSDLARAAFPDLRGVALSDSTLESVMALAMQVGSSGAATLP